MQNTHILSSDYNTKTPAATTDFTKEKGLLSEALSYSIFSYLSTRLAVTYVFAL